MLQDSGVAFAFRVVEIVRMGRQPWRASASEAEDEVIVAEALEQTETTALALRRFPSLSGGEKARVAFARALAQTPVLFLLDEPTAALDLHHQERVLARARDLAAVGDAVVVVLHDLTLAAAYADRVAVLDGGRLACVDAPGAALTSELLSRVYAHPVEVLRHPRTGAPLVLPVRGGEEGESR
jgi:iron complex transport system ATP-binding protein